jgi:hypothetical protein
VSDLGTRRPDTAAASLAHRRAHRGRAEKPRSYVMCCALYRTRAFTARGDGRVGLWNREPVCDGPYDLGVRHRGALWAQCGREPASNRHSQPVAGNTRLAA